MGNEEPREPKVFGAVFKTLHDEKRILHYGYTQAKNKQAHGRILRQWISREYSEKQSNNRKNNSTLNLFDNQKF